MRTEFSKLALSVWESRNEGMHGWLPLNDDRTHYITLVPSDDEDDDYLQIAIVEDVDALGYPFTEYIAYGSLEDGFDEEEAVLLFEWLVAQLEWTLDANLNILKLMNTLVCNAEVNLHVRMRKTYFSLYNIDITDVTKNAVHFDGFSAINGEDIVNVKGSYPCVVLELVNEITVTIEYN